MEKEKSKRKILSLQTKIDILDEVERGVKKKDVAAKYKIPQNSLSTIIKDSVKIRKANADCVLSKKRKRIRASIHADIDEAVYQWIIDCKTRKINITGPLIKMKARRFSIIFGKIFRPGNGWLHRFKKRYNLSFKTVCGDESSVDESVVQEWLKKNKEKLDSFEEKDIYNADETGLFYQLMPNKTISIKNEKCTSGKHSKVRITVLVCTNKDGSDKRDLMIIGKAKKPTCFVGREKTLPSVIYRNNRKAWMTRDLFTEWLMCFDKDMTKQKRKILLILDNCTAHNVNPTLKSIELLFLPPNTTSRLQPADQGIIQNLKVKYRRRLVERLLVRSDVNMDLKINLLEGLQILYGAWSDVLQDTIANCWRHAFSRREEDESKEDESKEDGDENESEITDKDLEDDESCYAHWERLNDADKGGISFEEFVNIDDAIEVCAPTIEDALALNIAGTENNKQDSSDEEEGEATEPATPPTLAAARKGVQLAIQYALSKGLGTSCELLTKVEDEFLKNACKAKSVQPGIESFFKKL